MEFSTELTKGTIAPIILKLLSEKEMYGYEIIKVVNQRTNDAFAWKEGTLYPWLHRLEGEKLIRSHWVEADSGRQRKYYGTTPAGLAMLANKLNEWNAFSQAVNAVLLTPALG